MSLFVETHTVMKINLIEKYQETNNTVVIAQNDPASWGALPLSESEKQYLATKTDGDAAMVDISALGNRKYVVWNKNQHPHKLMDAAKEICEKLDAAKADSMTVASADKPSAMAFLEGVLMSNYRFDKYKTEKSHPLAEVAIACPDLTAADTQPLQNLIQCVDDARNWVNEPIAELNAPRFAELLRQQAAELGVEATVLEQRQIESLKMGGLLGVNRGSIDEARFVVLEWKPKNAVNAQPIALVGKGIMYDTGGLNIKTGTYMYDMKSDMAGAATMAATLFAVAKNQLPVHVVALIPATDNRPGGNAYANGDILRMYDGTMVEVVNTDAEGRLVLADAIAYANRFNPSVIIDAATLTGAAERAIGKYGIVAMHQEADQTMQQLKAAGEEVYERIAEFPFWDEYGDLIKSDIADIKNSGAGANAGMITAGKFLAHFAKAPFVHLDIAGVAFADKEYGIYGKGATGFGIRLLYRFIELRVKN